MLSNRKGRECVNFRHLDAVFLEAQSLASVSPTGIISSNDLGLSRGRYLVRYDALRLVSRTIIQGRPVEQYKLSEYGLATVREYA